MSNPSNKSPLAQVKELHGGKDKLVDKLAGMLESDESKEDLKKRLLGVANSKLLRLHAVASTVKEKFGGKDKLAGAAAEALGRGKDKDYVAKLESFSASRLLDIAQVAQKRAKRNAAKAAAKPAAAK